MMELGMYYCHCCCGATYGMYTSRDVVALFYGSARWTIALPHTVDKHIPTW